MDMWKILRKPVLTAAAAAVLTAGAWTGLAKADGDFLEPFDPAYPEGIAYDIFTATLEGLGLLVDSDDDGTALNDERCDSNGEAAQQIALALVKSATIVGEIGCHALAPGFEDACFGLLTAGAVALVAAEINIAKCDLQDALVDGAEIEAGFENTVKLLELNTKIYEKQIEDNLLDCRPVVGLFLPESAGGLSEWVSVLVDQRIDQFESAIDDPQRVAKAELRLMDGDDEFAAGNFEQAYCLYCAAYNALADNDDDSDSDSDSDDICQLDDDDDDSDS